MKNPAILFTIFWCMLCIVSSNRVKWRKCGICNCTGPLLHYCPSTSYLNLRKQGISFIHNDAFIDNAKLLELDLSQNSIVDLSQCMHPFTNLHNLNISFNKLQKLPPLCQSLEVFDAVHNNIEFFPETVFSNLTELTALNIQLPEAINNRIFEKQTKLKTLNLANGQLRKVDDIIFQQLQNLEVLDISMNNLHLISSDCFKRNVQLRSLSLNGNKLMLLPDDVFDGISLNKFKIFRIENNPFLCKCPMSWVGKAWDYIQNIFCTLRNGKYSFLQKYYLQCQNMFSTTEEVTTMSTTGHPSTTITHQKTTLTITSKLATTSEVTSTTATEKSTTNTPAPMMKQATILSVLTAIIFCIVMVFICLIVILCQKYCCKLLPLSIPCVAEAANLFCIITMSFFKIFINHKFYFCEFCEFVQLSSQNYLQIKNTALTTLDTVPLPPTVETMWEADDTEKALKWLFSRKNRP